MFREEGRCDHTCQLKPVSLSLSLSSDAAFTNAFFLNDKFTENTIKVFTKETCFVVVHFIFHEEKKNVKQIFHDL